MSKIYDTNELIYYKLEKIIKTQEFILDVCNKILSEVKKKINLSSNSLNIITDEDISLRSSLVNFKEEIYRL
jgi:hypothetical protein